MFSAAWRLVAKIAENKNDEARMIRLRHATAWEVNGFAVLKR